MNEHRITPEEARFMVRAALTSMGGASKTSEIAKWTGLPASIVRRAGLYLASKAEVEAVLMPGRGSGEWSFQLPAPRKPTLLEQFKALFR
jgi:hypothetical protein